MQGLWTASVCSLRDIIAEVRGARTDDSFLALCRGASGPPGPSWPGVVTRLSGIEAALLQDVTWWGPLMEDRLYRWSHEHQSASQGSVAAQ